MVVTNKGTMGFITASQISMNTFKSGVTLLCRRQILAAILIVVIVVGVAGIDGAQASPDLQPQWVTENFHDNPNEIFLSNRKFHADESTFFDELLDWDKRKNKKTDYQSMEERYERQKNYGLLTTTDEYNRYNSMSAYRDDLQSSIQEYQIRKGTEKAKNAALADRNISKFKTPIVLLFGAVAVYNGAPLKLKVDEDSQIQAKTDKGKAAQFNFTSPVVNTSFEMSTTAPKDTNGYEVLSVDPTLRPEKYKVGLSRQFGLLDLSTAMTYGSTTQSVKTSLSQPIAPNTVCSVYEVHPLSPTTSKVSEPEYLVHVAYSVSF